MWYKFTGDMVASYRYNSETGQFTVPPGGAGLYFFHIDMWVVGGELARFVITVNGVELCKAESDTTYTGDPSDDQATSCGAIALLEEGNFITLLQ